MEGHIARIGQGGTSPQAAAAPPRRQPHTTLLPSGLVLALLLESTWLGAPAALAQHAGDPGSQLATSTLAGCTAVLLLALAALLWRRGQLARRREAALAQERASLADKTAQLEATLAGMSDGIMMMDSEMRLLAWNARFPDFTGVPADVLHVGASMADILRAQAEAGEFGAVDVEAEVARRMDLLRSGGSTGTMLRLRPGGRVLELRRNPIAGDGFVTLYADVTARQRSEQRLRQAEKMAAIGRLTAGIVHDFNNLLSTIIGNAELLERDTVGRGNPALERRLTLILQSAERGADLVRRLLAFARKQPLSPVAVDLNALVQGMHELLQSTIGRAVRLKTALSGDLWPALVDPVQMEHVILNLAINARDAMPDGGTLTIATENLPQTAQGRGEDLSPGDYVGLAVTDTGSGMTEDVRRNAFEPFFTTKPPGEGTGLGLSQVYGVASQCGGGVEIDSILGRGTTVRVLLPRADAHAAFGTGGGDRVPHVARDPAPQRAA
jgi:signal transduction histidine kinase